MNNNYFRIKKRQILQLAFFSLEILIYTNILMLTSLSLKVFFSYFTHFLILLNLAVSFFILHLMFWLTCIIMILILSWMHRICNEITKIKRNENKKFSVYIHIWNIPKCCRLLFISKTTESETKNSLGLCSTA